MARHVVYWTNDIVDLVSKKSKTSEKQVKKVLATFKKVVKDILKDGHVVNMQGFMKIHTTIRKNRHKGRIRVLRIKASIPLKEAINQNIRPKKSNMLSNERELAQQDILDHMTDDDPRFEEVDLNEITN